MDGTDDVLSTHGVRIPRLVYGTAWKRERTAALVHTALGLGCRGIDTACQPRHYDEAGVGAAVAAARAAGLAREALYLQTKFTPVAGQDPARIPYDPAAPLAVQVAESFRVSQRQLQVPWVDCLLLHSALPDRGELAAAWQAMEAIFDAGGARQLGISNCYSLEYLEALCAAVRVRPAVVQNRFHAATGYDRGIRAYCRLNGICYQSFWTLTANAHLLADPLVAGLAARHGRTPAQVLFRYLTQQGVVPLTGTTSPEHMREDLAIFAFALADTELAALTALLGPPP
jgi:diketogulonate reductase-like aldo/keto reductase